MYSILMGEGAMSNRIPSDPKTFTKWFSADGIVAVIVILVAISQAVLSLLGWITITPERLITLNIAILSVIASLSVMNSLRLSKQANNLKDIAEQSKRKDLPALVLRPNGEKPSLEELVQGAKRIVVCDAFLSNIRVEQHLLVTLLNGRCDVIIVVSNPHNEILLNSMSSLSYLESLVNLRYVLHAAINNFILLYQDYSRLPDGTRQSNGVLKVGFIDAILPFAGVLIETTREKDSKVLIELCPFKYDEINISRYHFLLEKKHTSDLFNTYKNSINKLAESSIIQDLSSLSIPVEVPHVAIANPAD